MELSERDETIRQNLIYYRGIRGLKNYQLAEACGVSRPTVTHWVNGRNSIERPNLLKLSEALGVTLDELTAPRSAERPHSQRVSAYPALEQKLKEMQYLITYWFTATEQDNTPSADGEVYIRYPDGEMVPITLDVLEDLDDSMEAHLESCMKSIRLMKK